MQGLMEAYRTAGCTDLGLVSLQALHIVEDVFEDAPVLRFCRGSQHIDVLLILLLQLQRSPVWQQRENSFTETCVSISGDVAPVCLAARRDIVSLKSTAHLSQVID